MKPIYKPKGAAAEYGDYAVNIYTGCPHRCFYCFAPSVRRIEREVFHSRVEPRKDIMKDLRRQLERDETLRDKLIHLCFTCDPYPNGYDTTTTREVIKALKEYGNHVQILTKGDGSRDFDLLDENDWYGITYAGKSNGIFGRPLEEPGSTPVLQRLVALDRANEIGIKTWMSLEPVLNADDVLDLLSMKVHYVDRYKIGKLNYHPSDINWKEFGQHAEAICKKLGLDYYIKDSLRAEMDKP